MTRVAICCVGLLVAAWVRADTLNSASHWPDLMDQARERGVDYPAVVTRARHGDVSALHVLFQFTLHTDGSAADSHCVVLRRLLQLLGDHQFSTALARETRSLRSKVTQAIDFDFGHPWQKRFPLTYALGTHDTALLKPHNEI